MAAIGNSLLFCFTPAKQCAPMLETRGVRPAGGHHAASGQSRRRTRTTSCRTRVSVISCGAAQPHHSMTYAGRLRRQGAGGSLETGRIELSEWTGPTATGPDTPTRPPPTRPIRPTWAPPDTTTLPGRDSAGSRRPAGDACCPRGAQEGALHLARAAPRGLAHPRLASHLRRIASWPRGPAALHRSRSCRRPGAR